MNVHGRDCTIIIKTSHFETDIPYSDETLREAVSFLQEEASIEGDGVSRGLRKINGATGCVVTPLTIGTAPLLLYLAMGAVGNPVYISETRSLYKYSLNLLPTEDTECFDLLQNRETMNNEQLTVNNEGTKKSVIRKLYENCRVESFELRIMRGEAVKLKLDITSERPPVDYFYTESFEYKQEERFNSDFVTYKINGEEYTNIYGFTLVSKKRGGTKTELWIKRALQKNNEIPYVIEEIIITAKLIRDNYEHKHFGLFRITLNKLVLVADETEINAADTVISPLRYYVSGSVSTEVFTSGEEIQ